MSAFSVDSHELLGESSGGEAGTLLIRQIFRWFAIGIETIAKKLFLVRTTVFCVVIVLILLVVFFLC